VLRVKPLLVRFTGTVSERCVLSGTGFDVGNDRRERGGIIGRKEFAVHPGRDQFAERTALRRYRRSAHSHCLHDDEAERLLPDRGHEHGPGPGHQLGVAIGLEKTGHLYGLPRRRPVGYLAVQRTRAGYHQAQAGSAGSAGIPVPGGHQQPQALDLG
jgi:hypothetical protein